LSARATISTPKNDPELWPTTTISSASLRRATSTRYWAKRSIRWSHSGRWRCENSQVQIGQVFRIFQDGAEGCDKQRRRRGHAQQLGNAQLLEHFFKGGRNAERSQCFDEQQEMRVADEGCEPPMRLPEPRNRAAQHQPPVDQTGMENRAPDRRGEVALDQVFEPQEVVTGAGLPVAGLGLDGPGCGLAVGCGFRTADGGGELIQRAELAQFGSKHAVILR
jgi:hypothetical protein